MARRMTQPAVIAVHQGCHITERMARVLVKHREGPQWLPQNGRDRCTVRCILARGWLRHVGLQTELTQSGIPAAAKALAAIMEPAHG